MAYGQVSGVGAGAYCGLPQYWTAENRRRFVRFTAMSAPRRLRNVEIIHSRPKEQ
jgi:hypothetical protein